MLINRLPMHIAISKNHIPIRLTDERLNHITTNHPEMQNQTANILLTVKHPEWLFEGDFGEILAVRFFPKSPVSMNKYLIVAYKEISEFDGFIITAYFSRKLNRSRKVLWKA